MSLHLLHHIAEGMKNKDQYTVGHMNDSTAGFATLSNE